jgi:hypothetical protein
VTTEEVNDELLDRLARLQADNERLLDQHASMEVQVQAARKGESDALREQLTLSAELTRLKGLFAAAVRNQSK